ncbi:alpha/beta fold hydrolase [Microbacterium sp. I2]
MIAPVTTSTVDVRGIPTFYREAGDRDAPVFLLPHGYPASSYEFRALMPALGDRWRLIAPDAPGFGYSATPSPDDFPYTFTAYTDWLEAFAEQLALDQYVLYLHDYGSQFGLELAMRHPGRVTALVIQNGDIYEDQFGPKYEALRGYWDAPSPLGLRELAANISEEGFRDEFVGELPADLATRVPPDLWTLHWALMTPGRHEYARLFHDQRTTLERFPLQRAYLREHRPPTLIVWGRHDGYMPEGAARAYLRDLPDAELHIFDGGHWLLETHLDEALRCVRPFLDRVDPRNSA